MSYKRYSCIVLLSLLIVFAVGLMTWHFIMVDIFFGYGDLSRIANTKLVAASIVRSQNYITKHKEFRDYLKEDSNEQFDVITIGSSCSNGGGGSYYQDYITDTYGLKVLNIPGVSLSAPQMLTALAMKGYLQRINPKYVILECVERNFHEIARWKLDVSEQEADEFLSKVRDYDARAAKEKTQNSFIPQIMMKACIEALIDKLYVITHPGDISRFVMRADLNEEFFDGLKAPRTLYYLYEDMNYLFGEFDIERINDKLNKINKIVAEHNIKLVFLGVPNKHSVYLPYIVNNESIPENNAFTRLDAAKKDYIFVNVKNTLRDVLSAERIKNLFWGDDTHWTYKAHKFVGDYIAGRLFGMK